MGQISRATEFANGNPPFADDLNAEMNQIASTGNNLDNDNFVAGANISETKFASTLAGSGFDVANGVLSLNTDDASLETSADALQVRNLGVTAAKLAANAVTTAKILNANVTRAKIATSYQTAVTVADQTITNTSNALVTSLTVTITTTGRPVLLAIYGASIEFSTPLNTSATALKGYEGSVRIARGATNVVNSDLVRMRIRGVGTNYDTQVTDKRPFCHLMVDAVAAGTYTYVVRVSANAPSIGDSASAIIKTGTKLFAMEL
jgi:hypothetical protein